MCMQRKCMLIKNQITSNLQQSFGYWVFYSLNKTQMNEWKRDFFLLFFIWLTFSLIHHFNDILCRRFSDLNALPTKFINIQCNVVRCAFYDECEVTQRMRKWIKHFDSLKWNCDLWSHLHMYCLNNFFFKEFVMSFYLKINLCWNIYAVEIVGKRFFRS